MGFPLSTDPRSELATRRTPRMKQTAQVKPYATPIVPPQAPAAPGNMAPVMPKVIAAPIARAAPAVLAPPPAPMPAARPLMPQQRPQPRQALAPAGMAPISPGEIAGILGKSPIAAQRVAPGLGGPRPMPQARGLADGGSVASGLGPVDLSPDSPYASSGTVTSGQVVPGAVGDPNGQAESGPASGPLPPGLTPDQLAGIYGSIQATTNQINGQQPSILSGMTPTPGQPGSGPAPGQGTTAPIDPQQAATNSAYMTAWQQANPQANDLMVPLPPAGWKIGDPVSSSTPPADGGVNRDPRPGMTVGGSVGGTTPPTGQPLNGPSPMALATQAMQTYQTNPNEANKLSWLRAGYAADPTDTKWQDAIDAMKAANGAVPDITKTGAGPVTFTGSGGNSVMPTGNPPPAGMQPVTKADIIAMFPQLAAAASAPSPTDVSPTVTTQGPGQSPLQVLSSLTPNRSNRFQSNDVAQNFWG